MIVSKRKEISPDTLTEHLEIDVFIQINKFVLSYLGW